MTDQLAFGDDPEPDPVAHARRADPDTSHEAAASVSALRDRQRAVLELLRVMGPMTDERLVNEYPRRGLPAQSVSGIRTRRSELVKRKLVVFTGEYQVLRSGRRARVWGLPGGG